MSKNLVIVESPTKAKTISKFLGSDYTIRASMGHVRDLPKSKMGVDTEGDFSPEYIISVDKKKVISELKSNIKSDTVIWVATDEDREGEAIGWHLLEALKIKKGQKVFRIVFHEITKSAILESIKNPRDINVDLVDAQQARRILDRLVGYELSPLLWKKVRYGLSAGRVQSVAVRLIVEREREIRAFISVEYWSVTGLFNKGEDFEAKLNSYQGKKLEISNEKESNKILKDLEGASYQVEKIDRKQVKKNPSPPFTTSTLQQEAARKLGMSVKKTMVLAQQLYEGIDRTGGEAGGLITYMRTDSVNISNQALSQAKTVITDIFGKEFALEKPRYYKSKKGAQEAHEAIRPTDLSLKPEDLKAHLDKDQFRLYELIWKRTLACQMSEAILDRLSVDIQADSSQSAAADYVFRATGQTIKFPGFMRAYVEGSDDPDQALDDKEKLLPNLNEGDKVDLKEILPKQHFTQPPPRYTEASLVKKLEAEGIGRPSTYAPTISTIMSRGYIEKEASALKPTDTGEIVNDVLVEHFPQIVDYKFTAKMEDDLDEIAEGKKDWVKMMKDFYKPFQKLVAEKQETISKADVIKARVLGDDPKSGKPVSVKIGRFGPFVQIGDKEDEEKPKFASLPKDMNMQEVSLEEVLPLFNLPRVVGQTADGDDMIVDNGRFGPYVRLKNKFYSLGQLDPYKVTKAEADEVIKAEDERKAKALLHDFPEEDMQVLNGRYGAYLKKGKTNYKIPKTYDPEKLTLEDCKVIVADEANMSKGRKKFKKKKT